ncbi:NTP transferase domain-containing protein [Neobacillus sp. WH10]|uniref:NTP transferase domain-containing protein n=1 Tax=Neobacillus sp. WH10 TaxID=3047873 RepID=UPI0024C1A7E2|nr:NTP transferase domain-containing protein [Neobacillus sp. WH10]WHY77459.1 NTP transferase domain-containing protein [Neobacillus sp. WH10]
MNRFQLLEVLMQDSEISQRSLAVKSNLSVGKVNYTLNQLADEKMIIIKKDGKAYHYEVTEKGREYLKDELDQLLETKIILHNNKRKVIKQAVILAAGAKTEFDKPACLLPIKDTTLLERTIGILENNGIEKIIIVTGYKKEAFDEINSLKENKAIHFVENPKYLWTGSMASLAAASQHITDDFILLEDDILIEESAVTELLDREERDCLLLTKESGSGDEAFIEIQNNYLYKISKDIHQLNRIDGEMTGITKFSYNIYKEMLRCFKTNKNPYVNYEYILLDVSRIINVSYYKIPDLVWAEIDSYEHHFKVVDKVYPMLQRKEADFKERELKQGLASALKITIDEVTSIEALGGLTNRNFKVTIGGQEYAARIPGKGTEQYINRYDEKINSEITSRLGINPEVIYFSGKTGLKIVKFIPDAETLNPRTGTREDNLIQVAGIFNRLHSSGETFNARFDVFEKITEYETILAELNGEVFEGHDQVKQQVLELEEYYKSLNVPLVPCHNDPLAENFVKSGEEKMFLVDWEFSGMNDPLWDVAAYIIEAELSPAEEKLFLLQYFNGSVTAENQQQLLLNKIFLDFLWTIWALMKEAGGEDFGSYAFNRFTRAQKNLQEYQKHYKALEKLGTI